MFILLFRLNASVFASRDGETETQKLRSPLLRGQNYQSLTLVTMGRVTCAPFGYCQKSAFLVFLVLSTSFFHNCLRRLSDMRVSWPVNQTVTCDLMNRVSSTPHPPPSPPPPTPLTPQKREKKKREEKKRMTASVLNQDPNT